MFLLVPLKLGLKYITKVHPDLLLLLLALPLLPLLDVLWEGGERAVVSLLVGVVILPVSPR